MDRLSKKEVLNSLQEIANLAGAIMGSTEAAMDYVEDVPHMERAEAERFAVLFPGLVEQLQAVFSYVAPLSEKYMYIVEIGVSAMEADHRDWVRSQGVWIDKDGVPLSKD